MKRKCLVSALLLIFASSAYAENVQEVRRTQIAQVEDERVEQSKVAQEGGGISDDFLREMAHWYGPKNYAMHTNKEYFNNAPAEVIQNIFDRWLNIDDGYLKRHPHWHKKDRSDITFENFINAFYFFPVDRKFSMATAICNRRENYNEIVLVTDLGKWFDLNQGGADEYSVSLWEWYNTVAIRSGVEKFIHHSKPVVYRWNAPIPQTLAEEILRNGQFEIYVESNQYRSRGIMIDKSWKEKNKVFPNLNLKANVTIQNINEVRNCFDSDV